MPNLLVRFPCCKRLGSLGFKTQMQEQMRGRGSAERGSVRPWSLSELFCKKGAWGLPVLILSLTAVA